MASGGGRWNSNQGQTIEDKKRELLRRIEEKKKASTAINPPLPPYPPTNASNSNTPTTNEPPSLFVNDGSFLARFQAMQNQQGASSSSPTTAPPKPSVTMKISTVKKSSITRPVLKRNDVFEREDDETQNGNSLYFQKLFCLLFNKYLLT